MKCIKYNSSLDAIVQNLYNSEGYIQLSKDRSEVIIMNKKPIANPKYIFEAE
jgi:hypothetical protein